MLEYYPWSKEVMAELLKSNKDGKISCLDLELSAKCTAASCIYCDSKPGVCSHPDPNELDFQTLRKAILEGKQNGLRWVYTCGLGEPMEDPKFWELVELLNDNSIQLSMFSNGLFIQTLETAKRLKENKVCIILKMDTFDETKFDIILGRPGAAKKIYRARDFLIEAGYGSDGNGHTDLAFSIVPSSLSLDGIPEILAFCESHGIFASVGELENAGEVVNNNLKQKLEISGEQTEELKKRADSYCNGCYMRPMCPCTALGVHIDNFGRCVVDKETGLNCKWFMLKDPCITVLGNLHSTGLVDLYNAAVRYRKEAFSSKYDEIQKDCDVSYAFGGCGGNPRDIIDFVIHQVIN